MEIISQYGDILVILACVFGFFMAWGVGANDVANAMGTSVGSKSITLKVGAGPGPLLRADDPGRRYPDHSPRRGRAREVRRRLALGLEPDRVPGRRRLHLAVRRLIRKPAGVGCGLPPYPFISGGA